MRTAIPRFLQSSTSGENRSRMRASSAAYCSSVYSRITNFFHPFRCFHRCLRLKMDIRDYRHVAAALSQTFHDVLEIACVLYCRRSDSDYFAARIRQLDCLLDRCLRVHRVTRDHRLNTDGVVPADSDVPNLHLARGAAMTTKRINAIVHENSNVRRLAPARNERSLWRLAILR